MCRQQGRAIFIPEEAASETACVQCGRSTSKQRLLKAHNSMIVSSLLMHSLRSPSSHPSRHHASRVKPMNCADNRCRAVLADIMGAMKIVTSLLVLAAVVPLVPGQNSCQSLADNLFNGNCKNFVWPCPWPNCCCLILPCSAPYGSTFRAVYGHFQKASSVCASLLATKGTGLHDYAILVSSCLVMHIWYITWLTRTPPTFNLCADWLLQRQG